MNRAALAQLAGLPILVKLGCIAGIIFLGLENNVLRHGLLMLPSYFAEGFLIAYILRMIHTGGDLTQNIKNARRYYNDIISSMIVYVLIKLALAFLVGITMSALPENAQQLAADQSDPEASLQIFMVGMTMIAFLIWSFRFLWLYIPLAMGVSLQVFLRRVHSFSSSFPMLGCWLACFMPLAFLTVLASQIIFAMIPGAADASSPLAILVVSLFQGVAETVIVIVSSVAMAYGFKSLMDAK